MFADTLKTRSALLHEIPKLRILVVGDVMLDRYLSGSCDRISQEAPVPIIKLERKITSMGGAANVAHNLAKLGVSVQIAGVVGRDSAGDELLDSFERAGIDRGLVQVIDRAMTVVKTRLLAGNHQIARFDEELNVAISTEEADGLLSQISEAIPGVDAVILSDYAKGVCTPYFCHSLITLCRHQDVPVYVDPKGTDFRKYAGVTAIKPNRAEMSLLAQTEGWDGSDLPAAGEKLQEMLNLRFVALTLGPRGIALIEPEQLHFFPTAANEVFDVSGAGDAVLAALVAGIHAGLELRDAVMLGNLAAGQVTARVGCVPVERADLLLAVQKQVKIPGLAKRFTLEELSQLSDAWKAAGQTVAFTNGCFDILHAGHIRLLEDSSANSDRLIVAVNSDDSVTRIKGEGRPTKSLQDRLEVLSAFQCVDAVVVFEEDTPLGCLEILRPDLLVKGENYDKAEIVGADFVESYGGRVMLIPMMKTFDETPFAQKRRTDSL